MAALLAAAMPVRLFQSLPLVGSLSILDLVLIVAAATLFLDLAFRPVDVGYLPLFLLLSVPTVFALASLVWSENRSATLKVLLLYAESLIAYLFVVRELSGLPPSRVVIYIKRYSYLLIIPGVLLLLGVPGFEPRTEAAQTSGDYLSYFTRLSHPILGSSNNLATPLAFFAPVLLYWGHTRKDPRATIAAYVSLTAIVATQSRGILLAFAVAGLLYAPLSIGRHTAAARGLGVKILVAVVVGIAGFGIYYGLNSPTREFFKDRLTLTNVTERTELSARSFERIASSPLLGSGAGVIPASAAPPPTPTLTNLDLFSPVPVQTGGGVIDIHNTYLQQAVYFGLPAALFISLALCGTAGFFLARRRVSALANVIAYALMVQLVSFVFEASFEGTVLRVLFYLSVGLAVALLRSAEQESQPPPPRPSW